MTYKHIFYFVFYVLLVGVTVSCAGKKQKEEPSGQSPAQVTYTPSFNSDSAYSFVESQVAFGPRVPGTAAHSKCALWLERKLQRYLPEVTVQKTKVRAYNGQLLDCKNIIAAFHPERTGRILLCAHWDSRPVADHDDDPSKREQAVLGANDGASGVGVLIEIARQLSLEDPGVGVDIVLFDVEDYGQPEDYVPQKEDTWCLGSQYWSKNPHKPGYTARFGILLDMVGAENAAFYKEASSLYYAPDVVSMVWETAAREGFSDYFTDQQGGEVTDDHYYINTNLKIPTIDIIQQNPGGQHSFFPYWHTTKDDMQCISRSTLGAVGNTLMIVLHQDKPV
jgi:hypothetical protein